MDTTTTASSSSSSSSSPLERVVPRGVDALDDLTAGELGTIGRLLKADPHEAVRGVGNGAGLRWPALAHVAWVWAKRSDPHAKLERFVNMRAVELGQVLGFDDEDDDTGADELDQSAEENPTDYAPAAY